ncbi:MAG: V-type ATPase subunit [Clostridia bacterium]|nr:V-type ATPase subunit [Clostridia bacterium]
MPQPSYAYACARLSALNKRLIEPQTIQRMLDGSASDAMRALSDVRYGNLSDATEADTERMIEREMTDAMQEVKELSPAPAITDLFLLRADVQNLKVLLKSRLLNQSEAAFTPGGLFDRETLTAMVKDRQYAALPKTLCDAMIALEKRLEIRVEPQTISIALDRAYLAHALKQSERHPVFSQYFRSLADFDNVLTFLRLRAMGASIETLDEVILPEGGVKYRDLYNAYELSFDSLNKILGESVCAEALLSGLNAMQRTGNISEVEKARDNYLVSLLSEHKYESETIYPIVGYYLAKEREGRAVRLIITGKRNGLPDSVIRERLVKLYGER